MAITVLKLKGMSTELGGLFQGKKIFNADQLLEAATTPAARKILAEQMGISVQAVLELANRADLARVKGIGGVFSDLLEQAGVDTIAELAKRRADNLYAKLVELNKEKSLAGRLPTLSTVEDWIAQAKALPRKLEY
jgi:predicted flap endonuclease-1-like 5' DNA nuclease